MKSANVAYLGFHPSAARVRLVSIILPVPAPPLSAPSKLANVGISLPRNGGARRATVQICSRVHGASSEAT
eukprot:scaffold14488_cov131-Isochrysis_galbana.AAC.7